jgi:ribose-phosphate pyrophosphokinase
MGTVTLRQPAVRRAVLLAGTAHPQLATDIAASLGVALSPVELNRFASGEIYVRLMESVRGCDVFAIQSHCSPVNDSIMEQLVMIDALKRASALQINAIVPYFAYARQDKKAVAREPISARLVADLLSTAGVNRVMSIDLHTDQIQGFFNAPVDHLTAMAPLAQYVRDKYKEDLVVVAPDPGRGRMAQKYADRLNCGIAFVEKRRPPDLRNVSASLCLVGDVRGKLCVVVDDIIDTAGTITGVVPWLLEAGAARMVVVATHAVLSPPAVERLEQSAYEEIIVTDTLPLPADCSPDRFTVVKVAPLIAAAIRAVFEYQSLSQVFDAT